MFIAKKFSRDDTMKDKFTILTETTKEFDLEKIWNENKDKGIIKMFLHYDYDTETLKVHCILKNQRTSFLSDFVAKEAKVDYFQLCVILTNIIQSPFFITSNTEKPEMITVEFGDLR